MVATRCPGWWAVLLLAVALCLLADAEHNTVVSLDEGTASQAQGIAARNFDDITRHLRHRPMLAQILPQLLISMTLKLTDDHKAEVSKMTEQIQTMLTQKEAEDKKQHQASHGACKESLMQADTLVAKFDKEAKRARAELRDLVREVGNHNGEASRSRHRAAAIEHTIANASAVRIELMKKLDAREASRHEVLAEIAEITSTACLQAAYRASKECSTGSVATGSTSPNRTVTGKYGPAPAGAQCKLPFTKSGRTYEDCVGHSHGGHGWCCLDADCSSGLWGSCAAVELTKQEIAGEATRSQAVEPALAVTFASEQPAEDDDDTRWLGESAGVFEDHTVTELPSSWAVVLNGKTEVSTLAAVISGGDVAAGQDALEQMLQLKVKASTESGTDLAIWFRAEQASQADIRNREAAVQAEENSQVALSRKIEVVELQQKKQRGVLAGVREQLRRAERAASKARLRCWQDDENYKGRLRARAVDVTVLDRLRTQFSQGNVDCDGGCNSPGNGFCAHRGKTDSKYCACRRGFYGSKCEFRQCPGLAVPSGELRAGWKPQSEETQNELFPAHHPLACSGHGACDKVTGKCGKCVATLSLCRHANLVPGSNAVEITGMRLSGKMQLYEASVMSRK